MDTVVERRFGDAAKLRDIIPSPPYTLVAKAEQQAFQPSARIGAPRSRTAKRDRYQIADTRAGGRSRPAAGDQVLYARTKTPRAVLVPNTAHRFRNENVKLVGMRYAQQEDILRTDRVGAAPGTDECMTDAAAPGRQHPPNGRPIGGFDRGKPQPPPIVATGVLRGIKREGQLAGRNAHVRSFDCTPY